MKHLELSLDHAHLDGEQQRGGAGGSGAHPYRAANGVRGVSKLCSRRNDTLSIRLFGVVQREVQSCFSSMPIGEHDNAASFCDPARFEVQLLWFQHGYAEYRFASPPVKKQDVQTMAVSFDACSEAPNDRMAWPSHITVSINGVELGPWCCPGDFGGRQGRCTPEWRLPFSTQYGMLKRWRVDHTGCCLDDVRISDVTLADLDREEMPYVSIKIAVKDDAEHPGGINLFGDKFGDHNQASVMRPDYKESK